MSFKEIKELRQAGKLDEALQMALQALEAEPVNIWNKRATAWVYYDYSKKYAQPDSFDLFLENLIKIKDLQLPEDEKMVFDNCAWQIGKMVFSLQKAKQVDYGKINELFDIIRKFHFTKPSEAYSFLYKAFHKGYQNWSNYISFADWWNFKNFRSEDYLKEEFNGKKIMSIAEQAYLAYSKKLLEGKEAEPFEQETAIDKDKIREFLPQLDRIIEEHPEYQYPSYFKAKLLLALGDEENTLSSFLPFAREKRNHFWVWELMAEFFSENEEMRFSCYNKALSLKTPEEYLVRLREKFAGMLLKRQMYNEAKTEIQLVIATRQQKNWRLTSQILLWTGEEWYKSALAKRDNRDFYLQNAKRAEELLYQDNPEEIVAVEFVNRNKKILTFVKNKNKFGIFKYSEHLDNPQIGDLIKVRFNGDGQKGLYKILSARKAETDLDSEAIREFEGVLRVISPQNFGFVDNVFIEHKLIQENNLTDGQTSRGKAILSFNKRKNEWGWKAVEIKQSSLHSQMIS